MRVRVSLHLLFLKCPFVQNNQSGIKVAFFGVTYPGFPQDTNISLYICVNRLML